MNLGQGSSPVTDLVFYRLPNSTKDASKLSGTTHGIVAKTALPLRNLRNVSFANTFEGMRFAGIRRRIKECASHSQGVSGSTHRKRADSTPCAPPKASTSRPESSVSTKAPESRGARGEFEASHPTSSTSFFLAFPENVPAFFGRRLPLTPTGAQGPGMYPITLRVTDNGVPLLSAERTFTVMVGEVNGTPQLSVISDRSLEVGRELTFTTTATDPDLPPNGLTFSLGEGVPTGATITAAGVFTWTPAEAQGGATYPITVVVADDGSPPLSDAKGLNLAVAAIQREIRLVDVRLQADGHFTFLWIAQAWASYRVQCKRSLDESAWTNVEPPIPAAGDSGSFSAPVNADGHAFYRVVQE